MREQDLIYWQDHRGVIRSISVEEYGRNNRARTLIDECIGSIALPADGRAGQREATPGENPGIPAHSERGENLAETNDTDSVHCSQGASQKPVSGEVLTREYRV